MTTLQKYRAACVAASHEEVKEVVDALQASIRSNEIILRGKGSLHSQLPNVRLLDQDAIELAEALLENTNVTTLNLSYNHIGDAGIQAIAKLIQASRTLKKVDLSFNEFGEAGVSALSAALQINQSVETVNLRGNKVGKGAMQVASMLQINESIQHLDIGDADLDVSAFIAFTTILNYNRTLKSLNLDRPILSSLNDDLSMHIAKMIKVNVGLSKLSVRKCNISDEGIGFIAESLVSNRTLQLLDVGSNKITRDGAKKLADMLSRNRTLKGLNLTANRLEDQGIGYIGEVLGGKANTSLEFLGVASNNIGASGLVSLSHAVKRSTLTSLDVWNNPGLCGPSLNHEACAAIADAITPRVDADVRAYVVDGKTLLAQVERAEA